MIKQLDKIDMVVRLSKTVENEFNTEAEEINSENNFADLYDDIVSYLSDVCSGKISIENIPRMAEKLKERLESWEIASEGYDPQYSFIEQEKDEDDFVNPDDM